MDDAAKFSRRAPSTSEEEFMSLSTTQRDALQAVERLGASLSLAGVILIFVTYAAFRRLRTVPNTFILFASIANVGASIACLIGFVGIEAGDRSVLCQLQGFLLEMFMQSDPWWSLAMAVNVFMVFFFATNPNSFRQYLWVYSVICFGAPALPAVICLTIRSHSRGWIYGNATLWCWIGDSWSSLRIFTYYLPIWICILLSALIYFAVGYQVFHQRNQLRNLTLSNHGEEMSSCDMRDSAEKALTGHPTIYGTAVTEVQITAELFSNLQPFPTTPTPSIAPISAPDSQGSSTYPGNSWSGHASGHAGPGAPPAPTSPFEAVATTTISSTAAPQRQLRWTARLRRAGSRFMARIHNLDPVKLAYLRTSFVFAISVLVTWAPSSINRVYTLVYPERFSFGLNMASAVVLPLQGVWNTVIYCATSWNTLRGELDDLRARVAPRGGRERLDSRNKFGRIGMGRVRGMGQDMEMKGRAGTVRVFRDGSL